MNLKLNKLTTRWMIGVAWVLLASQASASGSLAIDTLQGEKYGFSFNHPSSDLADQRAIRECGADCSVVMSFIAECAAYAADQAKGSNAYGWGTGSTSANSQSRAMAECRERGGSSCSVRAWGCDATKVKADAATAPNLAAKAPTPTVRQDNAQPIAPPAQPVTTGFSMMGNWLFDYDSDTGYSATGTIRITENNGGGNFRGIMVQSFTNTLGIAKRVSQDVVVTVRGTTVVVNGSNPVYLKGTGNYSPDKFTMSIDNSNLLRGRNSDSNGIGGKVVITRD